MVTQDRERREYAAYALEQVRAVASVGKVGFASRRVSQDIANLGYSLDQVCECLAALEACHFHESVRRDQSEAWVDVYLMHWSLDQGKTDPLYIKFKLVNGALVLTLISFHLEHGHGF
jgi:hypothetical protein